MVTARSRTSRLVLHCQWFLIGALTLWIIADLLIQHRLNQSEPVQLALAAAQSSPAILERLGTPVKLRWRVSGRIHLIDDDGRAELSVPIAGPKASGLLHAVATRSSGQWKILALDFAPVADAPPPL